MQSKKPEKYTYVRQNGKNSARCFLRRGRQARFAVFPAGGRAAEAVRLGHRAQKRWKTDAACAKLWKEPFTGRQALRAASFGCGRRGNRLPAQGTQLDRCVPAM